MAAAFSRQKALVFACPAAEGNPLRGLIPHLGDPADGGEQTANEPAEKCGFDGLTTEGLAHPDVVEVKLSKHQWSH